MNDRSRPKAAPEVTATTTTSITPGADIWRLLTACPAAALHWAALAWRAGYEDGRASLYRELGEAGQDVARAARPILARPSFAELQRRRGAA